MFETIQLQRLYYPEFWPPLPDCAYLPEINGILINAGSHYTSNDFYNALFLDTFSVTASEAELVLSYATSGRIVVELWHEMPSGSCQRIHISIHQSSNSESSENIRIILPDKLRCIKRGYIYYKIMALEASATISDVAWESRRPMRRLPSLALIITHFHREKEVEAFACSMQSTELGKMLAQRRLQLIIIDNSRSLALPADNHEGIIVIRNPNYGGSGGFARGMLEAVNLGHSHCLLLDDDASLGEEGIRRIWARHAMAEEDVAISAILLREEEPFSIIDAAANYNGFCKPIAAGLNILDFNSLKWLWHFPPHADYGAWCGFSFPLSKLRRYPFPFFIRGDDILFPMQNRMDICTLNGVTSRVPCFERKEGPLQAMLTTRAHMLINCAFLNMNPIRAAINYALPALNELLTYRYGHCLARHYGLHMYANSESSFASDMDGSKARKQAHALSAFWKREPSWQIKFNPRKLKRKQPSRPLRDCLYKFIFLITLNGHLIPYARIFQKNVFVSDLLFRISYKDALLSSNIIYYDHLSIDEKDEQTRICSFNQLLGLYCMWLIIVDALSILLFNYVWSRKARRSVQHLTNPDFWRCLYS